MESFEQDLADLERILRDLEDGTTSLEDALARYERGVGLLRKCYARLRDAEQKIQQLSGLSADGKPDLRPFDHTPAVDKAKPRRPRPDANGDGGADGNLF